MFLEAACPTILPTAVLPVKATCKTMTAWFNSGALGQNERTEVSYSLFQSALQQERVLDSHLQTRTHGQPIF